MAWFSNKFLWEALIVVALILDWSSIGEASGTSGPLISFDNQTDEIPNVVILNIAERQLVLDGLNVTLAMSIPENEAILQLEIELMNDTSLSKIAIDEITAGVRFDCYSSRRTSGMQIITLCNLDKDYVILALQSLTYTYNSGVIPESANDTSPYPMSITLTRGNISDTIDFIVQYRGANLAPPELSYNQTGDNATYEEGGDSYVYIFNGSVTITDDDHPTYLLQSATVEIVNYYSQDQLSVMNATLDYTFSNGVLTITQPASVADYEEAINNILYSNTDEEPLSGVRMIRINVTDSPFFDTELDITNPSLMIANSSTSDSIKIFVNVVNMNESPNPILNDLYLNETTGPVKINLTTIDSTDPQDEYTSALLVLMPASSEIESLEFNGSDHPSALKINDTARSIVVSGRGSKADYNEIFRNVIYHWSSTNGNLGSGNLTLTVTDYLNNLGNVTANIFVDDVIDNNPIFGFASDNVDRNSLLYPTTLVTNKVIDYNITEPVDFLNDIYLRDDGQVKNISIEVITSESTTDQLLWNETLGIYYTDITTNESTTFTADTSDEMQWEMFLMSFSFRQSAMRVADRNIGNRTITITAQDCSNTVTVTVIINVQPLPPVVTITVQNTTFMEGQNFILLQDELKIAVMQDTDASFISLTITLQIGEEGTYELGATEMLNTFMPPTELQRRNIDEIATVHTIIFSNPMGITDEAARQAIQSIVYLNYEREPLAFDDTGGPLLRKITISTVDMLARLYQTSFYITIQPINDNAPVIRLFTSGSCSFNSGSAPPPLRRKRTTTPQLSQRAERHSTLQQKLKMAPHITDIYGELTDDNCAAYIIIHFSAPVSHPYVDIWPRLSLVLSLSPQYLSDQQPTGAWDGQDTLIITFPEHNCSEWYYNDSHVTFKQSNDPCRSPVECLTGVCYSNYSGCRITGTFAFNFTTDHSRQATAIDCLYSPTSAPLIADTWVINILVVTVMLLLATIFFYCIWKYVSKRLHGPKEDPAQSTVVHGQPLRSVKHNRKRRLHKSSTIAQIAAKQQQVKDVTSVTENMSHDCHHGDCDRLLDKDENDLCNNHSAVEEIGLDKDPPADGKYRKLTNHNVTTPHNTTITSDISHDTMHINKTDTPRRPPVNDTAFPPDTT